MHAAQRPQEGPQSGAGPFTTVTMHFPHAIAIVIACPFVLAVVDRRVLRGDPMLTLVLVRIDDRPIGRYGIRQDALTGGFVAVRDHPAALFATLTADDMNNRWSVVVIGAMTRLVIGPPARGIGRVGMRRPFFPRVLIELIDLERLPVHHAGWGAIVEIGVGPLP